jgi:hypothetical protein
VRTLICACVIVSLELHLQVVVTSVATRFASNLFVLESVLHSKKAIKVGM